MAQRRSTARRPPAAPTHAATPRFVDDYLSYLLARAGFLVSTQFHARVKRAGLPVPVWRVLATLSDGDGLPIGGLARNVLFKQPTLTKVVDRMAADGLVERRAAEGDRRQTLVYITPRGRAAIRGLLPAAKRHEALVLRGHSVAEVARLKQALRDLIARCEALGVGTAPAPVRRVR